MAGTDGSNRSDSMELTPLCTRSSSSSADGGLRTAEEDAGPMEPGSGDGQQEEERTAGTASSSSDTMSTCFANNFQKPSWLQTLSSAGCSVLKLGSPKHSPSKAAEEYVRLDSDVLVCSPSDSSQQLLLRPNSLLAPASDQQLQLTEEEQVKFSMLQFFKFCGSGLLMSVSFLDPGNLEADIQVGVQTGYELLWWYATCAVLFGFAFQNLAGAVGLVTGQDLAQHCGKRYPKPARILLWLLMEAAIVGADIQETIGSAIAIFILSNGAVPLWLGCIFISVTAFLLLLLDRFGFRQLEAVFAVFIAVEAVALGLNFFQADIPAKDLAQGLFIPKLSSRSLPVAVGALGALVMPYNIFFQSSIINSRPRGTDTHDKTALQLTYMRMENLMMLLIAFFINLFVVCVFAKGFYKPEAEVQQEIGLETAGEHLAAEFGASFRTVWAVGLLAAGQVATISLTYAGQLVMTGLLGIKVQAGTRMVFTRMVALVPTVIMAVVFEASQTFDVAAQLLNVAQSILLPFALLPVMHIAASHEVMGPRFASARWLTALTGSITLAVLAVNGYLLYDLARQQQPGGGGMAGMVVGMVVYYCLALYFAVGPENVPGLVGRGRQVLQQGLSMAQGRRRVDYESMLEVHW